MNHLVTRIETRIEDEEEILAGPDGEEHERHGGEDDVEGDAAGEEQHVVLATVVPDALGVVAKDPPGADVERTVSDADRVVRPGLGNATPQPESSTRRVAGADREYRAPVVPRAPPRLRRCRPPLRSEERRVGKECRSR